MKISTLNAATTVGSLGSSAAASAVAKRALPAGDAFGGKTTLPGPNPQLMGEWTQYWIPFMHDFSVPAANEIAPASLAVGSDAAAFRDAAASESSNPAVTTAFFYQNPTDGSMFAEDNAGDVAIFDSTGHEVAAGNVDDSTGFVAPLPVW